MSQKVVEILLGRMLTDETFRREFFADPLALCREESLTLTPIEVEALTALDPSHVRALAAGLDARIVRAPLNNRTLLDSAVKPETSSSLRSRRRAVAGVTSLR